MSDLPDLTMQNEVYQVTDAQRLQAALRCAEAGRDTTEVALFLAMLGLTDVRR